MALEVVLPKVDMDMEEGTIAAWRVAEGDQVRAGDILFEMETNKAVMEVESPGSGRIRDLAPVTGEPVAVGTPVAWIDAQGDDEPAARDEAVRATPLARRTAREHGVELAAIAGSGPRGRIVARDVTARVEGDARAAPSGTLVPLTPSGRVTAQRLAESARTIPHFYLTAQIEMTALHDALRARAPAVLAATGVKPTLTMLIAHLVAQVLAAHPHLNASLDGEAMRVHAEVHLGVAMERDGDLLVPVLRHASTLAFADLVRDYLRLRNAVRSRSIAPADLRGGTFTISNLGMHGVDSFTAIIDPPQSAILAIGRTVDTPVGRGGAVVLRPLATFTLSSDHRLVDGMRAARFMADLRRTLENP